MKTRDLKIEAVHRLSTRNVVATCNPERSARSALTPALSSAEREGHSTPFDEVDALSGSPMLAVDGTARSVQRVQCVDGHSLLGDACEVPPLPGGEGWGEGGSRSKFTKLYRQPHPSVALLILSILLPILPALAAVPLSELSLVNLNTTDAQGRHWAYLAWQQSSDGPQAARMFAIYSKPGDANSASPYERRAVVGPQTDPAVIEPLLNRAASVGQNLVELEVALSDLFAEMMPPGNWTLAQKLSAILRGAQTSPDHAANLLFMGRMHPGVALCLGQAHAEMVPGPVGAKTTFELRLYDMVADKDLAVVGRVTATAGSPVVLPAADRPVEVRDETPQGNLDIKLRWATSPELRRLALLRHGFNVWRMTRAFAVQHNYQAAPPSTATLRQLASSDPNVRRLSHAPVLIDKEFTSLEAADFAADPTTRFFADDNDQGDTNSVLRQDLFVNGEQFYYFVTARDLLGRDGLVSPGLLATVCDRMPPPPPAGAKVVNHYAYNGATDKADQRLQVIWKQNKNDADETTTAYYVYRWTSITQYNARAAQFDFNRIAGPIAHRANSPTNSYLDNGPGAPSLANGDAGKTFWYTVLAVDAGACAPGQNRSLHSAPAWGVLRDRVGPAGGGGHLTIACTRPVVSFTPPTSTAAQSAFDTNYYYFRTTLQAALGELAQVEFSASIPDGVGGTRVLGRRWLGMAPDQTSSFHDFPIAKTNLVTATQLTFTCRVVALSGKESNPASSTPVSFVVDGQTRVVPFTATFQTTYGRPGTRSGDCDTHDPHRPGSSTNEQMCVTIVTTPGTKEYHLYRRIDDGPLTLVSQGDADYSAGQRQVEVCDEANPANPSEVCFFAQLFDEHGNPGPLQRIGCFQNAGTVPPPVPTLSELERGGTTDSPTMTVRWFCPPYPVERFEVLVAAHPQAPNPLMFPGLGDPEPLNPPIVLPVPAAGAPWEYTRILTRRVGPGFGQGPTWSLTGAVLPANRYAVCVRAISKSGDISWISNIREFEWNPIRTPGAETTDVPWPARALLSPSQTNFPGTVPRVFQNDNLLRPFEGLAVRIGEVFHNPVTNTPLGSLVFVPGIYDPANWIYRSAQTAEPLFPLAMYRYQVANANFPTVSGDVVQVTPMMEQIAFDHRPVLPLGPSTVIEDPFIRIAPISPGNRRHGIYLVDTQPVVRGAAYRYVLMRHGARSREPEEMIVTTSVEVPE